MKKIVQNKIVLLAASLILIGVVGVFVWKYSDRKNTNTTDTNGSNITQNFVTIADIPYEKQPGWKLVQDNEKIISFQIPPKWFTNSGLDDAAIWASNFDRTHKAVFESDVPSDATSIGFMINKQALDPQQDLYQKYNLSQPPIISTVAGSDLYGHLNVSGIKAVLIHYNSSDGYVISKGQTTVEMDIICPTIDLCNIAKQILGTVQFN